MWSHRCHKASELHWLGNREEIPNTGVWPKFFTVSLAIRLRDCYFTLSAHSNTADAIGEPPADSTNQSRKRRHVLDPCQRVTDGKEKENSGSCLDESNSTVPVRSN